MPTRVDVDVRTPVSDGVGASPPPTARRWAWWAAGAPLILGGLMTAAGGALRWWGPYRLETLVSRENDDAHPLHMGWTEHVHPGSGELVAPGQLLVSVGLLLLVFLPWSTLASRLIAVVAVLTGVAAVSVRPLSWVAWWAKSKPTADFPGWHPDLPDGLVTTLNLVGSPWVLGLGPLLLVLAVVLGSGTPLSRPWTRTLAACATLLLTAEVVEYFSTMILFLSDSHDDPVGTTVFSGLGAALAGAVLVTAPLWTGRPERREAPVVSSRRLRWWIAAGALFVASNAVALVSMLVLRPEAAMALEGPPPTAVIVLGVVASVLGVLAWIALAAGPWRGLRRVAVILLTVLVAAHAVAVRLFLQQPVIVDGPLRDLASSLMVVDALTRFGLAGTVVALLLLLEQARGRVMRPRGVVTVVLAAVVLAVAGTVLPGILLGGEQMGEFDMTIESLIPVVVSLGFGIAWLYGSVDASRHQGSLARGS